MRFVCFCAANLVFFFFAVASSSVPFIWTRSFYPDITDEPVKVFVWVKPSGPDKRDWRTGLWTDIRIEAMTVPVRLPIILTGKKQHSACCLNSMPSSVLSKLPLTAALTLFEQHNNSAGQLTVNMSTLSVVWTADLTRIWENHLEQQHSSCLDSITIKQHNNNAGQHTLNSSTLPVVWTVKQ